MQIHQREKVMQCVYLLTLLHDTYSQKLTENPVMIGSIPFKSLDSYRAALKVIHRDQVKLSPCTKMYNSRESFDFSPQAGERRTMRDKGNPNVPNVWYVCYFCTLFMQTLCEHPGVTVLYCINCLLHLLLLQTDSQPRR